MYKTHEQEKYKQMKAFHSWRRQMQPQKSIQLNMVLSKNKPIRNMRRGNPNCLQKMTWGGICILCSISVHSAALQKNTSLPEFLETLCMK